MRFRSALLVLAVAAAPLAAQQRAVSLSDLFKLPVDQAQMLVHGDRKTATLGPDGLRITDGPQAQLWYFMGTRGQRVRVNQRSDEFDTVVLIGRHGGSEPDASNDDYGDGTHSEATLTLPADGVYVIIASAFETSGSGSYTLALEIAEAAPGMSGPVTPTSVMLREADPMQRLGLGMRFASQLDASDPRMDDSTQFELWHVQATAGDTLQLAAESALFPPALHVGRQGSGAILAEAIHPSRAALRVVVPETGMYTIAVRSTRAGAIGDYVLELQRSGPPR